MDQDSNPYDPNRTAAAGPPEPVSASSSATGLRHQVIALSVLMSFSLYLDRICLGEIVKSDGFLRDLQLEKQEIGRVLGAFFFTYALFQVPAGWVSDRYGARRMMTGYILAWSLLTGLTGLMTGMAGLLLVRLGVGVAQAGAYPTSGAMIRRWIPPIQRGRASSLVSFGGRLGGTLAPLLTAQLILFLGGWRETLWAYGFTGAGVALGYWWIVRDRPAEHPRCNEAERALIGRPVDDARPSASEILPMLWSCCCSRSLWLNSLTQFCVNIGWVFLVTWLPTYLKESPGMPPIVAAVTTRFPTLFSNPGDAATAIGATMVTAVLAMGMVGQLAGGWATDFCVRTFGLRRGRVIPLSLACWIAGAAYVCCLALDNLWAIVACCGVVSLMTDVGTPSTWAFMQDVGGRNTAAIQGWGNMWGNLGAALNSIMVPLILESTAAAGAGQKLVFLSCAGAFLIAGLSALGMDATKPVRRLAAADG